MFSLVACVLPYFSHAFEIPPVGDATDWVRDYAGILSVEEEQRLETKVHATEDATHSQIAIVLIPSLSGDVIDEVGPERAEKWWVGYGSVDNGIFVLIAVNDHKRRIDVGDGLEWAVPDILAWNIWDKVMVPYFKRDDYFGGLDKAIDDLSWAIAGEYTREDILDSSNDSSWGDYVWILFTAWIILFMISIFLALLTRTIMGIPNEKWWKIKEGEILKGILPTSGTKKNNKKYKKDMSTNLLLSKDDKKRYKGTLWWSILMTLLWMTVTWFGGIIYFIPLYFVRKWLMFTNITTSSWGSGWSSGSSSSSGSGWRSSWSSGSSFWWGGFSGWWSSGSR